MTRLFRLLTAPFLLAALAAAAHGEPKTIRIALNQDPDILDPTLARSYVGRIIFANMCEKLYDVDPKGALVPQLAAAMPRISNGGKQVEIKLRAGLKFNDGTPVTAMALKQSLERHQNLKGSSRRSELTSIVGIDLAGYGKTSSDRVE